MGWLVKGFVELLLRYWVNRVIFFFGFSIFMFVVRLVFFWIEFV